MDTNTNIHTNIHTSISVYPPLYTNAPALCTFLQKKCKKMQMCKTIWLIFKILILVPRFLSRQHEQSKNGHFCLQKRAKIPAKVAKWRRVYARGGGGGGMIRRDYIFQVPPFRFSEIPPGQKRLTSRCNNQSLRNVMFRSSIHTNRTSMCSQIAPTTKNNKRAVPQGYLLGASNDTGGRGWGVRGGGWRMTGANFTCPWRLKFKRRNIRIPSSL